MFDFLLHFYFYNNLFPSFSFNKWETLIFLKLKIEQYMSYLENISNNIKILYIILLSEYYIKFEDCSLIG